MYDSNTSLKNKLKSSSTNSAKKAGFLHAEKMKFNPTSYHIQKMFKWTNHLNKS